MSALPMASLARMKLAFLVSDGARPRGLPSAMSQSPTFSSHRVGWSLFTPASEWYHKLFVCVAALPVIRPLCDEQSWSGHRGRRPHRDSQPMTNDNHGREGTNDVRIPPPTIHNQPAERQSGDAERTAERNNNARTRETPAKAKESKNKENKENAKTKHNTSTASHSMM